MALRFASLAAPLLAPLSASLRNFAASAQPVALAPAMAKPASRLKRSVSVLALAVLAAASVGANAQSPVNAQGNTISTYAGGYTGTYSGAGQICGGATSGSKYVTTDTLGDGCPTTQAILGPSLSGLGIDGAGNVFVFDYTNGAVRRIDAKSGIVSYVIGKNNTLCSAGTGNINDKQDALGSGCYNSQANGPATARGMNVDPYGNVILASYNSQEVNVVCLTASPLCPNTTGRKQVGSFYRVAGCVASQGAAAAATSGTIAFAASSPYTPQNGDNGPASPAENLSGDVTAWGLTGTAAANATVGATTPTACGTSGVNNPRNATADKYGNVWIADTGSSRYRVVLGPQTSTYFSGNNPMWAIINLNPLYTAHEGYIYTALGGRSASFTTGGYTYNAVSTANSTCDTKTNASSADAGASGCYFFDAAKPNSGTLIGIGVDKDGNPIFYDDVDSNIRTLYVGGTSMANMLHGDTGITALVGRVYTLEGTGVPTKSGLPEQNVNSTSVSTSGYKVAVDGSDNIYFSDNNGIYILDAKTGFYRVPGIKAAGTSCNSTSNGDGCVIGSESYGVLSSVGAAIAVDNQGNILIADSTAGTIRKVEANVLYPTAVGSTSFQNLLFHEPANTSSITATLLNDAPGITIGTPICTAYSNPNSYIIDNTIDCKVPVTFAPTVAGTVGASLQIVNTGGGGATITYPIYGTATGPQLVTDTANPVTSTLASFATGATPTSLATDTSGNFYTIDVHGTTVYQITPTGTMNTVGTAPANANQVAVDATGNVYVTAVGGTAVTEYPITGAATWGTSTTITNAAVTAPQGIVFDNQGNMYLSDATTKMVYQVPNDLDFASGSVTTALTSALANPTLLKFDGFGNLLIADTSIVYRLNASTGSLVTVASASAGGVVLSGLTPTGIAGDAGGNVYIQDSASDKVFEIPYQTYSGSSVTVLTGETTPSGITLDGQGNLIAADTGIPGIVKVSRSAETYTFPTGTTTYAGTFSNAGNVSTTGYAQTDPAEFPYTGVTGCSTIDTTHGLTFGGACGFTVTPNLGGGGMTVHNITTPLPNSNAPVSITAFSITSNVATFTTASQSPVLQTGQQLVLSGFTTGTYFNGQTVTVLAGATATSFTANFTNANVSSTTDAGVGTKTPATTPGSLTFTATEPSNTTYTTTTSIAGPSTASYAASGTEITFTVSEVASDSSSQNGENVSVVIDGGTPVNYVLASGSATVNVSGLTAGSHTIAASYGGDGTYLASSSGNTSFTITKVTPTVAWTPGATTGLYSAAIGAGNLNATASYASASVPGIFVYMGTPSGGSAKLINPGTFLAIGSYSLGVTFYPTDSVDYNTATGSSQSFTVNQDPTVAAIGGTQNVVAADGSGNYTSVQTAVTALGASGGAVYIKPGTYTGYVSVYQPNVSLRGLGGDPTAVILTHEYGAFNGSGSQAYAGEFTAGNGNGSQLQSGSTVSTSDPGSATLAVISGINTAIQAGSMKPSNFYAENLSVVNTWNTDSTTSTTTYLSGGTCSANAGTAQTYAYLYANSLQCASQAIAVVHNGDLGVYNNVYMTSLQDTLESDSPASGTVARQYYFRGKYTGQVDYVFGRGAAGFDFPTFYSVPKTGFTSNGGTIFAQQKDQLSGSAQDYLSGYVTNNGVFTTYTSGMTNFYFGRPYGVYGTTILLNSQMDQVNPLGWEAFSGANLPTATYGEYNDSTYSDPSTGSADPNGVIYNGMGGSSGAGVTGTRETTSTNPGTILSGNVPPTSMTIAQASAYFPANFLGTTVAGGGQASVTSWVPTTALANDVNAFVPASSPSSISYGASITILMRPQTAGLGGTANGSYTIPTGTYILKDNGTQIATGSLDASGEATYTSSSLSGGSHSFTWSYSGDSNFGASTTSTAYNLTVNTVTTTTTLSTTTPSITYGGSASLTATVAPSTGTAETGNVKLFIDGSSTAAQTVALSGRSASFTVSGLSAGSHTFTATYVGDSNYGSSNSSSAGVSVAQATLTVTAIGANRKYDAANVLSVNVTGYVNSDNASTVFSAGPTASTSALRTSPAGVYAVTASATLTTAGANNYSVRYVNGSFTVSGGAAQVITFAKLPNFPHGGSYQLTARSSSGLPVTYAVTTGPASVSGSTLTVTGTGTVTVQASCAADAQGNYAAATPVSQSFTAK